MIQPLPHSTIASDGVVPVLASLTDAIAQGVKARVIAGSMILAICLAAGFVSIGKLVFRALAITMGDFMMAARATSGHHMVSVSSPTLGGHR